jgi:NitT/TauT family transport system ATP-binding protein
VIGSPIISSAAASVKRASVEPQIVATNLGKTFTGSNGDVVAVEGVDLTVRRGEFCCIVGPSGCGKSTLLRILAGLERAISRRALAHTASANRLAKLQAAGARR